MSGTPRNSSGVDNAGFVSKKTREEQRVEAQAQNLIHFSFMLHAETQNAAMGDTRTLY